MVRSGRSVWKWLGISMAVTPLAIGLSSPSTPSTKSTPQQALKAKPRLDFNRDIRPILANNCFKCHGHDPKTVFAGLKLNDFATATSKLKSGHFAIVPGSPEKSELIKRINGDEDSLMPPADTKKTLTADEKAILAEWIKEGAEYKEHWGFVAPVRYGLPSVNNKSWPKNEIDYFTLHKMEESGLTPGQEADKVTLIRRLAFDITGLPPTIAEVDNFLADTSTNAYEKLVDKYLASARYGEHMASDWMDIARYADSNGYQADYERFQWRWRDWVIEAYNNNLPYNEFIIDQVAGDMLPNATLAQRMATGFGRNHRINTEGGVIAEEWRIENVIDRVETTSQAFLALTSGCARCHDHKFDPITQKEFYGMFAYFNNVSESGSGEERPINHPPVMKAPTPAQSQRLKVLNERIASMDKDILEQVDSNIGSTTGLQFHEQILSSDLQNSLVGRWAFLPEGGGSKNQPAPKAVGMPGYALGRSTGAVVTNKDNYLDLGATGDYDNNQAFSYGGWVYAEDGRGAPFAKMDTANDYRGWDAMFINGVVYVHLINKFPSNTLKAITKMPFPNKVWNHLMITYDGSMKPEGLKVYINGVSSELTFELNSLSASIRTQVPLTIGRRTGSELFNGQVDDFQLYNRAVSASEVAQIASVDESNVLLKIPMAKRSEDQKRAISKSALIKSDAKFAKLVANRELVVQERNKLENDIPTLMVMDELPKPRETFLLKRGQYDHPGEKVEPSTLTFLPPRPAGAPNNRLGFAQWLASDTNPLTARVAVNRLWERLFGTGIVSTVEDFGTRAEFPSHPELLDWLATEYMRLKWDTKAIFKTIVMSATYRQSSAFNKQALEKDPQNRLLARGPRHRLNAEEIRDQALAVSGLLFNKLGGPSVRPPQPKGIWDETNFYGNLRNYQADSSYDRYRRSMYTIWKRTAAPPNMILFDAPTREACRVRRARTDTPLQALTLMNDETYLEASRVLAQNVLKEAKKASAKGAQVDDRFKLTLAFRKVLLRQPKSNEMETLTAGYKKRLLKYQSDQKAAAAVINQGAFEIDKSLDVAEFAALTTICSTLLNTDEAVTKE